MIRNYYRRVFSLMEFHKKSQKVTPNLPNVQSLQEISIESCHRLACEQKETFYIDPYSGLYVMTEFALARRGKCCGNACRHCPFGHINVKKKTNSSNSNISDKSKGVLDSNKTSKN